MANELVQRVQLNPLMAMAVLLILIFCIRKIAATIKHNNIRPIGGRQSFAQQLRSRAVLQRRELARRKEEAAKRKAQERADAERENARLRQEAILLPRLVQVLELQSNVLDFSLLKNCLLTCDRIIAAGKKQELFQQYRESLLQTAVRLAVNGDKRQSVEDDLKSILGALASGNEASPFLLDFQREITLAGPRSTGRLEGKELEAAIGALTSSRNGRVDAIQKSSIPPEDKRRLIEEIDTDFTESLSKLVSG